MGVTSIQWCDHSINPIRARYAATEGDGHYCEKVSPGCTHCYSSRLQPRFRMPVFETQRRVNVEPYLHEPALRQVMTRKKPTKYFWCDMSDLFGQWVPDNWIDQCFAVMALTPQHTHLVLTKRAERMCAYITGHGGPVWPLSNVWLGVSVEDQYWADERIPLLLQTPAAVRFISAEPLIGPVDLRRWWVGHLGLNWVIIGGESGSKARPMDLAWARAIVAQCKVAGVALFYKQGGASNRCRHDAKGGCLDCMPDDLQIREYPHEAIRDESLRVFRQ